MSVFAHWLAFNWPLVGLGLSVHYVWRVASNGSIKRRDSAAVSTVGDTSLIRAVFDPFEVSPPRLV